MTHTLNFLINPFLSIVRRLLPVISRIYCTASLSPRRRTLPKILTGSFIIVGMTWPASVNAVVVYLPFTIDRFLGFFSFCLELILHQLISSPRRARMPCAWLASGVRIFVSSMKALLVGDALFSFSLEPDAWQMAAPRMTYMAMTNTVGEIIYSISTATWRSIHLVVIVEVKRS